MGFQTDPMTQIQIKMSVNDMYLVGARANLRGNGKKKISNFGAWDYFSWKQLNPITLDVYMYHLGEEPTYGDRLECFMCSS